ncbi:purine nucleosidase/pyrimidine-specific ribonucleoside hydrolase [Fontibacillus solani]|uniref:Purine nucleosidase/pyrimidine-specific ribonucleoside hydrolase n=1 Tax=Fontibacillus solani TaxID=1572857 RepID=A0A7W3SXL5_9BACL|nr:nucleoside hydrolase [Fontibacillus solani]MBA9088125.1 purine nucleosidase/pyrimidine-specific ribonucleoside hydrolase [Fontibacillus solani]
MIRKVIIDTDIGDDIDDALAIVLALNSPELDVIGLTTVYKNTPLRTKLALQLLKAYGKTDIPVATGIGAPMLAQANVEEIPCQWSEEYHDIESGYDQHAADFLIEQVRNDPEVTIAAIGPLTNLACAVMKEPDVMKRARIVLMGGMYSAFYPEWNIVSDPEAAHIVFNSGLHLEMVGLDVTLKCRLSQQDVERIKQTGQSGVHFLSRLLTQWMDSSRHLPILHDPLTIAYLSHPDLLTMKAKKIAVECKGEFTRGMTVDQQDVFFGRPVEGNAEVAVDVKSEKFIELFMTRLFR